ncbi:MAG TPA: TauD/TfdA family dioxygenase [Spongiibacteraceae bacterium]|jgi:taurine dioxygenase|nr:TauD/TfdA family dioxygenase [Spongiibacteraceae bacterium]HUH36632.1 TauD/TfdA family dioxygenase [Spongiibacteraceae bacterium]
MSIEFKPLAGDFGVEVVGDDLAKLTREQLYDNFVERGLLLLRGRELAPRRQLALSQVFGESDIHPIEAIRHPDCPELIVLTANEAEDIPSGDPRGDEIVGQIPWHSDLTYTLQPSRGAVLHAVTVPAEGGLTGWIDTAGVYDALSEGLKKRIEGLEVVHSFAAASALTRKSVSEKVSSSSREAFPEVIHPLVHVHPENGRKVLNISPLFTLRIVGLPEAESDALLAELKAFATQETFAYVHHWQKGDVMVWDNWRTMHRAYGYPRKYRRVMHRTTFKSDWTLGRPA